MAQFVARGVYTALVTPFSADGSKIDWAAFESFVEQQIQAGIAGLVPCGTTGESPTLSSEEKAALITKTVEIAAGRVPVLAGVGSNDTVSSVHQAKRALECGASAVMVVMPYYNRPCQRGLFEHIKTVASAVDGPLVVYNVPSRTSVAIAVDTLCQLAEACPNVVGLKDASGNVLDCQQLRARLGDRLSVLCGDDALTVALMAVGARGVISVTSNVLPRPVVSMVDAVADGRWEDARQLQQRLLPVHEAMFCAPSPAPAKAALAQAGVMQAAVRLPIMQPTEQQLSDISKALQEFERR